MILLSLALALFTAATPADTVPSGAVAGVVQSDPSGLPVVMAVVEIRDGGSFPIARSITDSTGAYALRGVAPGRHTLRVRHLEHDPLSMEVLVPAGGAEVRLDLTLRYHPLALDTVHAVRPGMVRMGDTISAHRTEVAWVDARAIEEGSGLDETFPLTDGGPPADPAEVFRIRGSASDLKLVLLDGAPVYAPFHMGGLMDAFEPGVLSSARLYLGGAPARYDGGLSYVMDLATRGGNRERHTLAGAVDVVTARGVAEGPLPGGATYLGSGRVVHGAWMREVKRDDFPYLYGDGVARVDVPLGGGVLRGTAFANREGARMDGDRSFAGWQNLAGSVRYRGGILGEVGELTAAHGDFTAALRQYGNHVLQHRGYTRRGHLALDLGGSLGPVRLRYGTSYDYTQLRYEVDETTLGRGVALVRTHTFGGTAAAYVDGSWQPVPRLSVRGGVRVDAFTYTPLTSLSPRGSLTWLLGDRVALTVAAGRYHQLVRTHLERPQEGDLSYADTVRLNVASELRVASANHVSVALDQELADGVRLGVEGFFKHFRDVPTLPGTGYNSGMDVWVRRGSGPVSGWLGYTLTWAWAMEDGGLAADDIFGRQVLSAGVTTPLGRVVNLSARFQYGSSLSAADIFADGGDVAPRNVEAQTTALAGSSQPLLAVAGDKPYVRLDAELSRTWQPRVAGRVTDLTPYFRVINALDQREPLFYQSRGAGEGPSAVGGFPILPVLGVQWKW